MWDAPNGAMLQRPQFSVWEHRPVVDIREKILHFRAHGVDLSQAAADKEAPLLLGHC